MGDAFTTGQLIRNYRKKASITLKELGDTVGLSEQAISQYELDKRIPDATTVVRISNVLGVSPLLIAAGDKQLSEGLSLIYGNLNESHDNEIQSENKKTYEDTKRLIESKGYILNDDKSRNDEGVGYLTITDNFGNALGSIPKHSFISIGEEMNDNISKQYDLWVSYILSKLILK